MLQIKNKYKIYTAITEYTKLSKKGNKVNKKKVASQILVFLIFFAIIIIAIVIQNNNIHTETVKKSKFYFVYNFFSIYW
jgi:predicted permease